MCQMKEQDRIPEDLRKVEISNLPYKEFKVMIIKMFNKLSEQSYCPSFPFHYKYKKSNMATQIWVARI